MKFVDYKGCIGFEGDGGRTQGLGLGIDFNHRIYLLQGLSPEGKFLVTKFELGGSFGMSLERLSRV